MTTTPQSMSDLPELPEPSEIHADRWEDYGLGYTEEQMREYGRLCRATAEQAGKVEGGWTSGFVTVPKSPTVPMARAGAKALEEGNCGVSNETQATYIYALMIAASERDAKPTQPAAAQQPVAVTEATPYGMGVRFHLSFETLPSGTNLYAAPVSPSREVEALVKHWRDCASGGEGYNYTSYEKGRIDEKRQCADDLERALAPVQEKAP